MSPRPRRLSDSAILEAGIQVVSRTGPERFTLADVGEAVGLSAATLVQRFGTKQAMLLAMFDQSVTLIDDRFAESVKSNESPLDALYFAAVERYKAIEAPETMSNRLAFLLLGLREPAFYARACESTLKAVAGYTVLLDNALTAGELAEGYVETQQMAETIHAMTLGSLMMWSIVRDGTRAAHIKKNLDALLRPYRRGPRRVGSSDNVAKTDSGPKPVASTPSGVV